MDPHAARQERLRDEYGDQPDQKRPRLTNHSDFTGVHYVAWGTGWNTKQEFILNWGGDTGCPQMGRHRA